MVTGYVKTISDGRFVIRDQVWMGMEMSMGRSVVLEVGDVYVLLTERIYPGHLSSLYYSVGLNPETAKIVVAKSPFLFLEAYRKMAKEIILLDAPGISPTNLLKLSDKYKFPPRPLFPFDESAKFKTGF